MLSQIWLIKLLLYENFKSNVKLKKKKLENYCDICIEKNQ
jgi:hypothetical protein